ncbi:MAG: M17 family peptidase N-terminal domain-containing protein, partial [Thermoanaerobaculia bacterium]
MGHIASIEVVAASRLESDLLAAGCFEGETPAVDGLPEDVRRSLERLAARAGFKGREEQRVQTEAGPGGPVVALYGLGARRDFTYPKLAAWLGRLTEEARHGGEKRVAVALPAHEETSGAAAGRILRAMALAPYRFDRFQSDAETAGRVERLAVVPP